MPLMGFIVTLNVKKTTVVLLFFFFNHRPPPEFSPLPPPAALPICPLTTGGYPSRLQLATLRSDAWWAHIPEWSIPPDKRIPRDNAPTSDRATATPSDQPAGKKSP